MCSRCTSAMRFLRSGCGSWRERSTVDRVSPCRSTRFRSTFGPIMRLEDRIRSISYLKAHAAELIRDLNERQEPLVITQNGEARAVLLDVATFDQLQETSALLK